MKLPVKMGLFLAVSMLPLLLLLGAGFLWLWQEALLLPWMGLMSLMALLSWLVARWLKPQKIEPIKLDVDPFVNWTTQDADAWRRVEALAQRVQREDPDVNQWEFFRDTLKEVMESVALHYYPKQRDPLLEIRIPDLLKVIELLARDLRVAFTENVPGSHILTINDMARGRRLANRGQQLYTLYRFIAIGIDPVSAAIRELRGLAAAGILSASTREIKQWLLDAYVKKIGYYAIELYSGRLVLDEAAFRAHITAASRRDAEAARQLEMSLSEEPLRILVLGQVKAGKSSLINALFGEMKALVDVVPITSRVQPYLLQRGGVERAIILDTAGYADSDNPARPLTEAAQEVLKSDLILLVCSALSASRQADRRLLQELQAIFTDKTGEALPPVIVVLSHIDQLRPFREWQPPYNIAEPDTPKAHLIRRAMDAVAADLGVELSRVVPVNLKPGQEYNIEEGLIPAILQTLDNAKRLKYLRCLADYHDEAYWQQLWVQGKNAGKIIARRGVGWLGGVARGLDALHRPGPKP